MAEDKKEAKLKNTAILPCGCANEYQDARHGQNRRVHNRGGGKGNVKWSCTVCGSKR